MAEGTEGGTAPAVPTFFTPVTWRVDYRSVAVQMAAVVADPAVARLRLNWFNFDEPLTTGSIDEVCETFRSGEVVHLECADGTRIAFLRNDDCCPGFFVRARRPNRTATLCPCITCEGFCEQDGDCDVPRSAEALFRSLVLSIWGGALVWALASDRVVASTPPRDDEGVSSVLIVRPGDPPSVVDEDAPPF